MLTLCSHRARISAWILGAVIAVLVAALLVSSSASAAVVRPPITWKVLHHQDEDGCGKTLLLTWPRVPGEWDVWLNRDSKSRPNPARYALEAPFNDILYGANRTVRDRAPRGMHQYLMRGYRDEDCAKVTRLVNSHIADSRVSVEVYTTARRLIQGTVKLDCAKQRSCPRANGVEGVKITAGKAKATTTAGGHYLMKVAKGVHTVRANAGAFRITTKPRRVDLRKRTTAKANFKGCGLNGRATLSAVGGGTWKGGNKDCLNAFEISWRGSARALSVSWVSMPRCATGIGKPREMVRGGFVDVAKPGHNLIVEPNKVSFMYPLGAPQEPNNVHGELLADGTGSVTANAHFGECTYGISNLAVERR